MEEAMGTFSFSAEYLYLNTVGFAVISLTWFVLRCEEVVLHEYGIFLRIEYYFLIVAA